MYSLISSDDKEVNKAKGINKKLKHKEYHDALFNEKVVRHNRKRIQSKLHEIGTYDVFKISLSCFDDKRYVLDDGINTLAYFQIKYFSCFFLSTLFFFKHTKVTKLTLKNSIK